MIRSRNLGDVVAGAPDPTSIALIDLSDPAAPREWSYDALDRAAAAVARGLVAHGAKRGDRIAILAANRVEYLTAFLGDDARGDGVGADQLQAAAGGDRARPARRRRVARVRRCRAPAAVPAGTTVGGARRRARRLRRAPGRLRPVRARGGRGRDDPLHVRLVRPAQGRAADPRRRAVDRRPAAAGDAGPVGRAPPRRRAALPHERALDHLCRGVSRPGERRPAAALLRARLTSRRSGVTAAPGSPASRPCWRWCSRNRPRSPRPIARRSDG